MKCGLAAALLACREAASRHARRRRPRRRSRRRGAREPRHPGGSARPCRADAAIVTEPTELELIVTHKGFVWQRSKSAAAPRTARGRTSASTRSPRPDRSSARLDGARPRAGRSGCIRCSAVDPYTLRRSAAARSCRATRRCARSASSAARFPARRATGSASSSEPCSRPAAPRTPTWRPPSARCSCASRSRSHRTRRSSSSHGTSRQACSGRRPRSAAPRFGPTRHSSPPPASPRSCSAPAGDGRPRRRGVGQHLVDTEAVARTSPPSPSVSAFEVARQHHRRPGSVAAPSDEAAPFHAALPGYRPTPVHDTPGRGRRARAGGGRRQGRVRPARAARVQGARRVVGGRARAPRRPRRTHAGRGQRRQPRPRCGARGRVAPASMPRVPAGAIATRPPRGDCLRRRRHHGHRRRLRGRGRAGPCRRARRPAISRSPTSATRGRRTGSSTATQTLFAETAGHGRYDADPGPGRGRVAGRGGRAVRGRHRGDARWRRARHGRVPDRGARRRPPHRGPDPGDHDGRS